MQPGIRLRVINLFPQNSNMSMNLCGLLERQIFINCQGWRNLRFMIIFGWCEMNSIANKLSFSSCCNKLNQTPIGWTLYSFRPLEKKIWNKLKWCPFRMISIGHEFPVHWSIYYGNNDFHIDKIFISISIFT